MYALLKKEISGFFSSATGYLVIIIYLLLNSLFLWIFPGYSNVLDNEYASLQGMFDLAPWLYLFLISAVTMKMFADEKRTGTIELLLIRPISDFKIIFAKYLAALSLVIFSLIPSLIYFYSVYLLGDPIGNIDTGGTWGSYIGLFFLAATYVSIGIFSSSITNNQIIAFIISVILCFLLYMGFDFISTLNSLSKYEYSITLLGINEHYNAISKGVVDTRDLSYFIIVIMVFLSSTKLVLQSRKW